MSGSLNPLTTWQIALTSLIWLKNLFPSPSPFEAPAISPAISTNSTVGGTSGGNCPSPSESLVTSDNFLSL